MSGMNRTIGGVIAVGVVWCLVAAAAEPYKEESPEAVAPVSGGCCGKPALVPICRCEPTTKKKQKTEYDVKCELVCVPGCSGHLCGKRHGGCSGGCSDAAGCCDTPCCDHATIRPKKTLLKKVVEQEEEAWEYKVDWVCAECATGCCSGDGREGGAGRGRSWRDFWRGLFHWK